MATRIYEQQVIRRSIDGGHEQNTDNVRLDKLVSGARFVIQYDEEHMQYELNWSRPTAKGTIYGEDVIEFVYKIFFQKMQNNEIRCFTEHRVNDVIFRADCTGSSKEMEAKNASLTAYQDLHQISENTTTIRNIIADDDLSMQSILKHLTIYHCKGILS